MTTAALRIPGVQAKLRSVFDRHGAMIISIALLVVFAWLLAKWTWMFLQPKEVLAPAVATTPIDVNSAAERIAGAHIFGVAGERNSNAEAQISTLNLHLKGVFAFSQDTPAFAIVNTGAKDDAFKVGDEIVPGVRLTEVQSTNILIKRGVVVEKINLEEPAGGGSGGTATGVASPPRPSTPIRRAPATSNKFNLSRSELTSTLQDPKQLINLGKVNSHAGGGVFVEDIPPNSLTERMGLRTGDVIRSVNGNAINSPADLGRIYQNMGQAAQVKLEITRNSRSLNLTYNMQQ